MLRILVIILIYFINSIGFSQSSALTEENKYTVNVSINDIRSEKGEILFALYDTEENFIQRKPSQSKSVKIINGTVNVLFTNLDPQTYAVVCFHDSNSNRKMDFESNGMPLEDYGATNNVMNYGPPRFMDAKFELIDKDLTFEIKL